VAAPLYIAEISPAKYRGRLAGMFQFNVVFGILIAFVSNASLAGMGENAWRWMLGVEALPALAFTILCFSLPESPRWLIAHAGKREEGIRVFQRAEPATSQQELERRADEIAAAVQTAHPEQFFTRRLRFPIMLAVLIAFFNQFSGINAVLYFSPRIFEMTGMGESSALLQSIGLGVINLIFTIAGLWLIDRFGRRTLLYIGSIGYVASLGLCSWAFYTETYSLVAVCIFAFIAAHAIGQGTVVWVFISEIFPNRNRAAGQSLGSFTIWISAAVITSVFPVMAEHLAPGTIFAFFCFMMVLQLLWVHFLVPETKNVPLEEMQSRLGIADEN
jgi:sugar porter (SP) family MFS transporter